MDTCSVIDAIRHAYLDGSKGKTLNHVEEVAETAVWLAEGYHLDTAKARLAALLHDISVIMTPQEMYEIVKSRGMKIDPAEEKYHFLLHQRVSRIIASEKLNIHDKIILDAIECHTPYDTEEKRGSLR